MSYFGKYQRKARARFGLSDYKLDTSLLGDEGIDVGTRLLLIENTTFCVLKIILPNHKKYHINPKTTKYIKVPDRDISLGIEESRLFFLEKKVTPTSVNVAMNDKIVTVKIFNYPCTYCKKSLCNHKKKVNNHFGYYRLQSIVKQ